MATQLVNLPAYIMGDAEFREWGKGISDALAAIGLVKTTDTGQINWTTVARPASNGFGGYEVWRFSDAHQAEKPCFIKLEYGVGSAPDRIALAAMVGTATNGAGAIQGQAVTRQENSVNTSTTPGERFNTYISGDSGSLRLFTNLFPLTGIGIGLIVTRTTDAGGTPTADGIAVYSWRSSNFYQLIAGGGAASSLSSGLPVPPFRGGLSSVGVDVSLAVPTLFAGKVLYTPAAVVYNHADIGELASFQANVLGALRTYMPLGDGGGGGHSDGQGSSAIALLWE